MVNKSFLINKSTSIFLVLLLIISNCKDRNKKKIKVNIKIMIFSGIYFCEKCLYDVYLYFAGNFSRQKNIMPALQIAVAMEPRYLNYLKFRSVFISCTILAICVSSSEVPRPRGVSLSRAPLYNPEKDFTCFDGSLTIPFNQVNDDYCDCADASDEPGTAACPNGFFHCTNAGHKPLNIPSYRVNDGVCDCCDASDEYANSNVNCESNCNELGRSAREEAQKQAELLKAGKQIRAELVQRGAQLKQEKKEKLSELEKSLSEAEKVKAEKEGLKNQIEELENSALEKYRAIEEAEKQKKQEAEAAKNREEANDTFKTFDSNGDGKIDILELKARQTFDKDRNGEVSDEEARYFLNDKEEVELEEFVTDAWARIKPFLMMDAGLFKPPVQDTDKEQDTEHGEDDQEDPDRSQREEGKLYFLYNHTILFFYLYK